MRITDGRQRRLLTAVFPFILVLSEFPAALTDLGVFCPCYHVLFGSGPRMDADLTQPFLQVHTCSRTFIFLNNIRTFGQGFHLNLWSICSIHMEVVGKSTPEREDLEQPVRDGFDCIELYLTTDHLDAYDESVQAVNESGLDVVSVHTPHVSADDVNYLEAAARMADDMDALLVFHSTNISMSDAARIGDDLPYERIAYENHSSVPPEDLERFLDEGYSLMLDVAHLYRATDDSDYWDTLSGFMDKAAHVHLCDARKERDNLPLGDGDMDLERVVDTIESSIYDGPVVLEVMPAYQRDAKERVEQYLNDM